MNIHVDTKYTNGVVELRFGYYPNGRVAIDAYQGEEAQFRATVNIPEVNLAPDEVILKGYSENEGVPAALEKAHIVGPVLYTIPTGFVFVEVRKLLVNVG